MDVRELCGTLPRLFLGLQLFLEAPPAPAGLVLVFVCFPEKYKMSFHCEMCRFDGKYKVLSRESGN